MRLRIATICLTLSLAMVAFGQEVPDSIASDGVPTVPKNVAELLARYQNGKTASFQDWLPGRREVLYLTRAEDTNQVFLASTPGGERRQLTRFPDRVAAPRSRPGHDQYLVSADEGGAENYQVFLVDLKVGTSRRLTDGKSRNLSARWSNSGKFLAWSSNARNGKDMDLYVMDPDAPDSTRLVKEVFGSWSVGDWSPDDRQFAVIESISANETYVHLVDVASGRSVRITPRVNGATGTVAYNDVLFSKDGASLYWTTDLNTEFLRLARFDFASKGQTQISAMIPWDVEGFDLSDDNRTIVLATNEDGLSKLHVFDVASGLETLPRPSLPAGQVGGLKFREHSHEFAFTFSSARSPADVYTCNLDDNMVQRWTTSETGGIDTSKLAEPALVHFKSFDERLIPAFVYRPSKPTNRRRPVLIDIHGGPEGQFQPGYLGRTNALIDELGIVLIYPNVRGSSGYGKDYLKLDNGRLREDSVKDIGALLDWVATEPDLDPNRVAVQGGSYGGYMALSSMTHFNDRLKAGVDVVGISNFVTFLNNTQSYRRDLRRVEYGDERDPRMAAFLQKISPLTSAGKITRPLLVVQGKNDPRVPVTESEQMVARVRKNGGPVWYVVGKNEGHGFAKKPNQDYQQAVEVNFLRRYLLGMEGN
jgi:dipeptidyl aminopeptidase/acylaminoacyl peptidase